MISKENLPFEPFYLSGKQGSLFALYFPPQGEEKGNYLYVPPFAEEMNRCRSMTAMQARDFAAAGYGVLLLDLFGTGDSDGHFDDAGWDIWKQDILTAIDWFNNQGKTLTGLWGTRLGALLAADVLHDNQENLNVSRLILWQPIIVGKTAITQFLRIRIAASLDLDGKKETTNEMRELLANDQQIEVGGYALNKALTEPVDSLSLKDVIHLPDTEIVWFEQVNEESKEFSIASQKLINSLLESSAKLKTHGFVGPAFWQLHERAQAQDLIQLTTTNCAD